MSAQKVRRYDVHIERVVVGEGASYAKTVPHANPTGCYIEYADVAGLVEALRLGIRWSNELAYQFEGRQIHDDVKEAIEAMSNELARWQS